MRSDAQKIEDERLEGLDLSNYPWFHERHRIFPEVLLDKGIEKVIDLAAGVGVVAKRIKDDGNFTIVSNDISEQALKSLRMHDLNPVSFDLDDPDKPFPFESGSFDGAVSLATIEHIINLDFHMQEIRRILKKDGYFFVSAPNYSSVHFFIPYVLKGRSFHDPLSSDIDRYEFYAHVRYFTYKTLLDFVRSFGFIPVEVYLPLPRSSSRFQKLRERSFVAGTFFKLGMRTFYTLMNPRWAFHPVLCFRKDDGQVENSVRPKKVLL